MARWIALIIRHGDYHQLPDTPSAHQPFSLNNRGRQQAIDCVDRLKSMIAENNWQLSPVIHSSNLLRAWQTAKIIQQGLPGIENIEGFDELAERGLGSAANLTVSQIEKILKEDPRYKAPPANWKSNSRYCLPLQGAESLLDAGQRVADHLIQLADEAVASTTDTIQIIVGHGAAFRHAAHHLGILGFDDIARLSMFHAVPVALARDEAGHWQHIAGQWKTRRANSRELD